jgi:hypothetical protein
MLTALGLGWLTASIDTSSPLLAIIVSVSEERRKERRSGEGGLVTDKRLLGMSGGFGPIADEVAVMGDWKLSLKGDGRAVRA